MKKILVAIILSLFFNSNSFGHLKHYAEVNYLEYDLYRNNNLIGSHKYNFIKNGDNLTVKSVVNFKITKLGIDLYKYFAESSENYEKNSFTSFKSTTIQNKKNKYVKIRLNSDQNKLIIDGSSYKGDTDINYMVGTWWNHEIVKAKAQISAISGRVIHQKVSFLGKKQIKINGKTYEALHFKFLSSDQTLPDNKKLNTDIWYDAKTLIWLKAQFIKQGNWEYRLKKQN
tara:strand:+ start:1375 stop:2058 length:684 start_codon:yes stop_codon:yes gene_type:complete